MSLISLADSQKILEMTADEKPVAVLGGQLSFIQPNSPWLNPRDYARACIMIAQQNHVVNVSRWQNGSMFRDGWGLRNRCRIWGC